MTGRILLGLVPLVVLVAVVESGLWALNLGERPSLATTSRGFDESARYLVPADLVPGSWRTQVNDDPELEQVFPPRSDATRVLLVGGSNTKLFPTKHLERYLNEGSQRAGTSRSWEVLNIGRPGYGSERIRIYLEQAMVLQPDVVVIYAGHNEFVEASFAAELGRGIGTGPGSAEMEMEEAIEDESEEAEPPEPPWTNRASEAFRALRSFNLMAEALTDRGAGSSAWADGDTREASAPTSAPEPWAPVFPAAFDLRPEMTRRHYEVFEQNLATMCETARKAGARVLLCTPLANLLVAPSKVYQPRWAEHVGLSPEEVRGIGLVLRPAKMRIPERFREFASKPTHLRVFNWYTARGEGIEEAPYEAPTLRRLGPPLDVAPADDNDRLSRSAEGAHWPAPREWGVASRDHLAYIALVMERKLSPEERAWLQPSAQGFREVVEMTGRMPEQLFALATVLWLLGDDEGAVRNFQAARDLDSAPHAASSIIHESIRRVAAARPDVALLDSAAIFTAADPNGLPGYEMLMDACHLQPGVRVELMRMIAEAIPPLLDG